METKVTEEKIAYTEVLNILQHIEKEYYDKIPKNIIEFLEKNSIPNYNNNYETNINIKLSSLSERLLCWLNLEYWCDEDEKRNLIKIYKENDKKLYDIQNIFDKRNNKNTLNKEQTNLLVPKENILKKFLNKIKSLFRR